MIAIARFVYSDNIFQLLKMPQQNLRETDEALRLPEESAVTLKLKKFHFFRNHKDFYKQLQAHVRHMYPEWI